MSTTIDYTQLIDEAMRGVVRKVLQQVQKSGLPDGHHFYVSFLTQKEGVELSPQLRARFPEQMTIVLQHQFWDLQVHQQYFSIMLSFNNTPERLVVPFEALSGFADPDVKFGLQFQSIEALPSPRHMEDNNMQERIPLTSFEEADKDNNEGAQVISLDAFRKK